MQSMSRRLCTAPGSWGVEPGFPPDAPAPKRFLAEAVAAGFGGVELGPLGYLPTEPADLATALQAHGLGLSAGFVMEPLASLETREQTLEQARRVARLVAHAGGRVLVVIDGLDAGRGRTAGRCEEAERLDDRGWHDFLMTVGALCDIATEQGLTPAFHPHAATHVEFEDEIDRLMADAPPELGLCLDTAHLAYAGVTPRRLLERHGDRLAHVHLKDLRADRLQKAKQRRLAFLEAVELSVFCPIGDGVVDFTEVATLLDERGFDGWCTFEQDRTLSTVAAALGDARRSLRRLRGYGI